jgi:excinuclease ABC subunit A
MNTDYIEIKNARTHNLKNISLKIPLNKMTCLAGPSGSGKSSLAFHTLYAESKRQFINSFPSSLKFYLDRPAPPDVESIRPVLPAFALAQSNPIMGPRMNVLDALGIAPFLQRWFFLNQEKKCSQHHVAYEALALSEMIDEKLSDDEVMTILITPQKYFELYGQQSFPTRVWRNGVIENYQSTEENFSYTEINSQVVYFELFRFKKKKEKEYLAQLRQFSSLEFAIHYRQKLTFLKWPFSLFCPICKEEEQKRTLVEFNSFSALGACEHCQGYGEILEYDQEKLLGGSGPFMTSNEFKLFSYQAFSPYKKCFDRDIKMQLKGSLVINEKFKKIFWEGGSTFPGVLSILKDLEKYKYKHTVRIFLRRLQIEKLCFHCHGSRLRSAIGELKIQTRSISSILVTSLSECFGFLKSLNETSSTQDERNLKKIINILQMAEKINLGHLKLSRKVKSLSSSEYQKLLLLKHLSYEGAGSLFIFDEPSAGLCLADQKNVFSLIRNLCELGNTVICVEHSPYFIENSDVCFLMGPGAGEAGGFIEINQVAQKKKNTSKEKSKTLNYVSKKDFGFKEGIIFNKKYNNVFFETYQINLVRGSSGTGKTAVVNYIIGNQIAKILDKENKFSFEYQLKDFKFDPRIKRVVFLGHESKVLTSRSTVGTTTDFISIVRKHFAQTKVAKELGLNEKAFSSYNAEGMCSSCEGAGNKIIEMQFLEDIILLCEDCRGIGIKSEIQKISNGKISFYESLTAPISKIIPTLRLTPKYERIWSTMRQLNIDYLNLNRPLKNLSGGERQRLLLLDRIIGNNESTLFILENITSGLSYKEVSKVMEVLNGLREQNHTVILIDQNDELLNHPLKVLNFDTFKC